MSTPILLIGPMGAGKTTVALALAQRTGRQNVPLDRIRWHYYLQAGYSIARERALREDFTALTAYWKGFDVEMIHRALRDFPGSVMDFGAGHTYFVEPERRAALRALLAPLPFVFHLQPSPDREESLRICTERLTERYGEPPAETTVEMNRRFIWDDANAELATRTFYTHGATVDEVADAIVPAVAAGR